MDAYLKNKLNLEERLAFEQQIQQDPLLQGEINLQRQIVSSLAEVRKAELKARLDAVPIDTSPFWYSMANLKWFAGGLATVSLGLIAYFHLPEIRESNEQTDPIVQLDNTRHTINQQEFLSVPKPAQITDEKSLLSDKTEKAVENTPKVNPRPENTPSLKIKEKSLVPVLPDIIKPEVINEFDDSFQNRDFDDIDMPKKDLSEVNRSSTEKVEIQNILDDRYDFHYQYYDNKLFLYGDFKGIPYEILALNNADGTRLFLSYNDQFYMINRNQREALPLLPIENQQLVKELKIISTYK